MFKKLKDRVDKLERRIESLSARIDMACTIRIKKHPHDIDRYEPIQYHQIFAIQIVEAILKHLNLEIKGGPPRYKLFDLIPISDIKKDKIAGLAKALEIETAKLKQERLSKK